MKKLLRAARRKVGGFTLVELMIALLGGLFVALAVVALSKQATNTVFEESRTATAEMSGRVAIDRLRADLSRAAFMSTGNVRKDPRIMVPRGYTGAPVSWNGPPAGTGFVNLASLQVFASSSVSSNINTLSTPNGLGPDAIRVGGNLTTTDDYVVEDILPAGSGSCLGNRIALATDTPSMYRIGGSLAALQAAFLPVAGANFMIRLLDLTTNKYSFHVVCAVGFGPPVDGGVNQPYVDITNTPPVLAATEGGPSGFGAGRVVINPVQLADWYIGDRSQDGDASAAYAALTNDGGLDAKQYDLYRQWVDATGARVGLPELVAEYAIDLQVALTWDNTTGPPPASGGASRLTSYGFGDANNRTVTTTVSAGASSPQRVRSIRVRLATRAAQPDRTDPLPGPDAGGFMYRYCWDPPTCSMYARVRTFTTDVALPNQAQLYY